MASRERTALVRLSPRIQHYEWGDKEFIPRLLGLLPDGSPHAEAWFGAHSASPANAMIHGSWRRLDHVIAEDPVSWLGDRVFNRYGSLPYLLKILAAARPLSIQVHPERSRAAVGFAMEELAGVPIESPLRRYRDPNHKPEMILALTDFYALSGFRPYEEQMDILARLPELAELVPGWGSQRGLDDLVSAYFEVPQRRMRKALSQIIRKLGRESTRVPPSPLDSHHWLLHAHREVSRGGVPDLGLLLVLLLSLIHLRPGQALFLPAGTPHAYLRGAGIEVMASSDNVLRAGLTKKHVDRKELLRALKFDSGTPLVLGPGIAGEDFTRAYPAPAAEFGLHSVHAGSVERRVERTSSGPEILLSLSNERREGAEIVSSAGRLALNSGEACLVPHGIAYTVGLQPGSTMYRVCVPEADALWSFKSTGFYP